MGGSSADVTGAFGLRLARIHASCALRVIFARELHRFI
jgi:hypothetical protein